MGGARRTSWSGPPPAASPPGSQRRPDGRGRGRRRASTRTGCASARAPTSSRSPRPGWPPRGRSTRLCVETAEGIVADRLRVLARRQALARALRVPLPRRADPVQTLQINQLSAASGDPAIFEPLFAHTQEAAMELAVLDAAEAARGAATPAVRRLAQTLLPVLKRHLAALSALGRSTPPRRATSGAPLVPRRYARCRCSITPSSRCRTSSGAVPSTSARSLHSE